MKQITVLGGGTGSYVVLSGLKKYEIDLSAIVTMMDSGGSTGRLRDQLGVLPPGDLRQCLVALSEAPLLWRKLFLYRFENGDLSGHNFGNIFLSALQKCSANYHEVIETASFVLKTKGEVVPVTYDHADICVEYEDGKFLKGEKFIDSNFQTKSRIKKTYLQPEAQPNPQAINKITEAEYLIIGPGDIYTSIVPIFLVNKIKETLAKSKGKIIYVLNLMTKLGQTPNYKAKDHVRDLENYIGRKIDYIIINNGTIPQNILKWYEDHGEKKVEDDIKEESYQVIREDLIDRSEISKDKSDKLFRSILRHDSEKLAMVINKLL